MKRLYIGVDTSCYTTSAACVDENGIICDKRTVLSVKQGERGLRESEGLFQHVRNLSSLVPGLISSLPEGKIAAVAVSARPRPDADSYMPVFLAGRASAAAIAATAGAPLIETSHQEGHLRAALYGNESLMGSRFMAMHISGGTTEALLVGAGGEITLLGGSSDLHAGQLVDRVGVAMGMAFPCGKELEKLAAQCGSPGGLMLRSSVKGCDCSFSGAESEAQRLILSGAERGELAYAIYECMARTFSKMLVSAAEATGCDDALISGGVASSALLRKLMRERMAKRGHVGLRFGESALSSDNAVGIALIARDRTE